jgi:hypothetical protein
MKRMLCALIVLASCGAQVKVEPVTINPIHITVDVNLHDGKPDQR